MKLNEIFNKQEPIVAFRGTGVKDSGSSNEQKVSKPGEFGKHFYSNYHNFNYQLFGQTSITILAMDTIPTMESSQHLLMEFIFFIHKVEHMAAKNHT